MVPQSPKIEDIGDVQDDSCDLDQVESVKIIGVHLLDTCMYYKLRKPTYLDPNSGKFGTCPNCKIVQLLKEPKLTARLFLETQDARQKHITVRAYDKLIKRIAQTQEVTSITLLDPPPFDARFKYHVITSVTRY